MTGVPTSANLFSIPADRPFVDDLAHGLLARSAGDPVHLAQTRVLLPTRRACRSLREAFLRIGDGRPRLLPRMTPLGDVDEDDLVLESEGSLGDLVSDIPPAMGDLKRQMILTRLVGQRDPRASLEQNALLAQELARLLNQVATGRIDFDSLGKLAADQYARHWEDVLRFLEIITTNWPAILAEYGAIDPAERRNRLLAAQAALWSQRPPKNPVIAAGSTGSIPATADLLAVVAALPDGAVILPGLDRTLCEETWQKLDESHPQAGLARLLRKFDSDRSMVRDWPLPPGRTRDRQRRTELLSQALVPATAISGPVSASGFDEASLEGVSRIDCADPVAEGKVVALIMREALEIPARTAALVTPDRNLARRVAAELRRWDISIDDSAGQPLAQTVPAVFLRLVADLLTHDFNPVTLLAMLKHPLAGGGMATAAFRTLARRLEVDKLRGPRPRDGWQGLMSTDRDVHRWLQTLADMTRPITDLAVRQAVPLVDLVRAHVLVAERLASTDRKPGADRLWAGEAGEALALFFAELGEGAPVFPDLEPREYTPFLETLMRGRAVRPRHGRHPRLHIWGPLEARLQQADVMILGGLNEGTWPAEPESGPWMSRPMMAAFGLPPPERRTGLAAHDFVQAFSAPTVYMTRATRAEGTPTVAARWLQRLAVLVEGTPLANTLRTGDHYLGLADALDRPMEAERIRPAEPRPTPPVADRPVGLSVTRIETWLRDPYAIYAEFILGLKSLDPINQDPTLAERGNLIHNALERFVSLHMSDLPGDAEQRLLQIGRNVFAPHLDRPGVRTFWWPRFERIAEWFIAHERDWRRCGASPVLVEDKGTTVIDGFTLCGKADRIDRLADGRLAIIDYKTGAVPTRRQVAAGLAPQLPLEAVIAANGGFKKLGDAPNDPACLLYWQLSGGLTPGRSVDVSQHESAVALREEAQANLRRWIAYFNRPETAYVSRRRAHKQMLAGAYDHLARVREWAGGHEDSGE